MNPLYIFGREMTQLRKLLMMKAVAGGVPLTEYTATGNPLTFDTNVAKPLSSMLIPWTPTQSGTGDPSPENVRPISGVSGLTAWRTGVNVFDGELENGYINGSGNNANANDLIRSKNYIPVVPGVRYCCYYKRLPSSTNMKMFFYGKDKSYLSNAWKDPVAFTVPNDAYYIRFYMDTSYTSGTDREIAINYPSTETEYTPYSGASYPVTFPAEVGTIYGGSLDLTTGVLTAEWFGADFIWKDGVNSTAIGTTITMRRFTVGDNVSTGVANNMSNVAPYTSNEDETVHFYYAGSGSGKGARVFLPNDTDENTQIRIVSKRPSPITYQLTPQQIQSLIGTNTIWSDTNGSNTAKYLKKG